MAESDNLIFHEISKRKLPRCRGSHNVSGYMQPDLFPIVYPLLTSVAVCTISFASVERLFSTLKRINASNSRSMGTEIGGMGGRKAPQD